MAPDAHAQPRRDLLVSCAETQCQCVSRKVAGRLAVVPHGGPEAKARCTAEGRLQAALHLRSSGLGAMRRRDMLVTEMLDSLDQRWAGAMSEPGMRLHFFPPPNCMALHGMCWGTANDLPGLTVCAAHLELPCLITQSVLVQTDGDLSASEPFRVAGLHCGLALPPAGALHSSEHLLQQNPC